MSVGMMPLFSYDDGNAYVTFEERTDRLARTGHIFYARFLYAEVGLDRFLSFFLAGGHWYGSLRRVLS